MSATQFRPFRNYDPPDLVRLWNESFHGRGVASPITPDIFDAAALVQTYFDPAGLIVAQQGNHLVGFVHVGFCVNADQTGLDHSQAVICAIAVDPAHRHQQIATGLLEQARQYARGHGSEQLFAGPSPQRDPFYCGIYGGSRPSGFLSSHETLGPFLLSQGFEEYETHRVLQKNLQLSRDPVSFRLMTIRRKMDLRVSDQPDNPSWWWMVRLGRYEHLRFEMYPKQGGETVAGISVVGLDFYIPAWNERAVGLLDLYVLEQERRKGYAQALLIELGRRLKEEMVTLAEIHVPEDKPELLKLAQAAGFEQIDTGIVYQQTLPPA